MSLNCAVIVQLPNRDLCKISMLTPKYDCERNQEDARRNGDIFSLHMLHQDCNKVLHTSLLCVVFNIPSLYRGAGTKEA